MGLIASYKKSKKLRRLQLRISPPPRVNESFIEACRRSISANRSEADRAIEEFLDMVESDPNLVPIIQHYGATREELASISKGFGGVGLGGWIRGHLVEWSSIAYPEPLFFILESTKRGSSNMEIAFWLTRYWRKELPQGELIRRLQGSRPTT